MTGFTSGKSVLSEKEKLEGNSSDDADLIEIEQELDEIKPKILEGIPKSQRKELLQAIVSINHHSGPLPAPKTLAQYNEIIPNGAERIMAMAEKQHHHRIELEKEAVTSQLDQSKRGQWFGLIISFLAVGSGTYLTLENHEYVGGGLLGVTLTTLVSLFIKGKSTRQKTT